MMLTETAFQLRKEAAQLRANGWVEEAKQNERIAKKLERKPPKGVTK